MTQTFTARGDGTFLLPDGSSARCILGRSGVIAAADKREGDGASPAGTWHLRRVFYRPDRVETPVTSVPVVPLKPSDGWCADPSHPLYNRPVSLPFRWSHERLWRDDHAYDIIVELGHNDSPPVPGLGSAIFMHLQQPDGRPTEGCVALKLDDMLNVLAQATLHSSVRIAG